MWESLRNIELIMRHLPTIAYLVKHKLRVFVHSVMLGVPLRGFLHDYSKITPIEYFGIGRHFHPSNPTEKERNMGLFKKANAHHIARNDHELPHWYNKDGSCIEIPESARRETVCDWAAFQGLALSLKGVRENARKSYANWARNYKMHPSTRHWFERFLELPEAGGHDNI